MKRTVLVLISGLLCTMLSQAQPVRSHQLIGDDDPVINMIFDTWQRYATAAATGNLEPGDYGMEEDIIRYMFRNFYLIGDHSTFNIQHLEGEIYEINNIVELRLPDDRSVLSSIYKVCASLKDGEVALMNYFDYASRNLEKYTHRYIDFYYPCTFDFDREAADGCIGFIEWFCGEFGVLPPGKIRYVVANSIDECNRNLGFSFTLSRSSDPIAGYYIYPNTVVSCRVDHYHELVHVLMKNRFPDGSALLHEGIATYYGGGGGMDYRENLVKLRQYISDLGQPLGDISAHRDITERMTPYNVVGAILIDVCLTGGGPAAVMEIFGRSDSGEPIDKLLSEYLGVEPSALDEFILKFIDSIVPSC